jgi:hypothetical protein
MTENAICSWNPTEVIEALDTVFREFKAHDLQLLTLDVDERAITHRIAKYLEQIYTDWHIDCEYNRRKNGQKELPGVGKVRPDIIIHHRYLPENFLVLEVKKGLRDMRKDRKKLIEFTKPEGMYHYHFGILLVLSITMPYVMKGECYQNGNHIRECDFTISLG